MRQLTCAELLSVWERGYRQPLPQQAFLLVAAACPEVSPDALARLSIGRRDGCLLMLREQMFGPEIEGRISCPACNGLLELNFKAADVRENVAPCPISSENSGVGAGDGTREETHVLENSGYRVHFRLPNTLDLVSVAGEGRGFEDVDASHAALLERCLLSVERGGAPLAQASVDDMPPEVLKAVLKKMADVDPQADITLALNCPVCRHRWIAPFDILSFLWQEIEAWASRLLDDVHTLAAAYCWREADILALSARRRQFYLDRVRG